MARRTLASRSCSLAASPPIEGSGDRDAQLKAAASKLTLMHERGKKMADIKRTGKAIWKGDLRAGEGHLSSGSGVLRDQRYTFRTRFEQDPGTNPEELIAAAHAACYSMALAHALSGEGCRAEQIETAATCTLATHQGGFKITRIHLDVRGRVPGLNEQTFERIAKQAEQGCPVSNALRQGVEILLQASLV